MERTLFARRARQLGTFMLVMLAIELVDELAFGTHDAAMPLIKDELNLTYDQIGLLLGIPFFLAVFIEPFFGILSNMGFRKRLMIGGGVLFGISLIGFGLADSFSMMMIVSILNFPSSGAFVGLAQAALMDYEPKRHEQNMARWTLAGSIGVAVGSLGISVIAMSEISWRVPMIITGILAFAATLATLRLRFPPVRHNDDGEAVHMTFRESILDAVQAAREGTVIRWYVLIILADLMMDVLFSYLALYLVDAAGADFATGALAVTLWTGVGLIGDILLIPFLERVRGLVYLRWSAFINLMLFPAFLLVPDILLKLILISIIGFFNAGWYSILQAQTYTALIGRSGTEMTLGTIFNSMIGLLPLGIGLVAERLGIGVAIWLLLLGPVALLIGIPRQHKRETPLV